MKTHLRSLFLVLAFSFALRLPATAQVTIATVPVGTSSNFYGIAVNSVTNKTYVVNSCGNNPACVGDGTVTVIDGATLSTQTVLVGSAPYGVAVNSVTNKIYVANLCGHDPSCNSRGTVTVIDGATLSTQTVTVGSHPFDVAVNSVTNKIYVVNACGNDPTCVVGDGTVTVIDGATLSTQSVNVGMFPYSVAVNPITNKIYVVNACGNDPTCSNGTVTVIDGVTLSTQFVNVGNASYNLAVNSVANKIYVLNECGNDPSCSSGTVTVIDGVTLSTQSVTVGSLPYNLAINSATNKTYVVNGCGNDPSCSSGTVTVIDGVTLSTQTVNVGISPYGVAVNPATNKIYVPNGCGNDPYCGSSGTMTVIDGATNSTTPVSVGDYPQTVAVNAATNRIYVSNQDDRTVSVVGGDTTLQFVPVTPCRVVDTRKPNGPFGGPPIQGGILRSFPLPQSACNIPATAAAYSLNVTAVPHGALGYLTIWPAGEYQPAVSTMNSPDGRVKANAAIVQAGVYAAVSVYVSNTSDVVLDIDGYFVPASGSTLAFYPLPPCRIADTRNAQGDLGGPFLSGGVPRDFPVLESQCGLPQHGAQAYSLNITAVPHVPLGYLTVWPSGQQQPGVSTLNAPTGVTTANAAIVPAGNGGDIEAFVSNDSDLVIDVNGYFAAPGTGGLSLYPVAPCRVLDTRNGNGAFVGELTVDVAGSVCGSPNTAQAYVFNATVVPPGPLGYLTLWPDGGLQPGVSTLNAVDGAITSNMGIVHNSDGKIDAYASNLTQLVLDISSYFAP